MTGDDRDLRDRFAALRREEEVGAPEFVAPSRPGQEQVHRRSPGVLVAAAACLAILVAGFLWPRPRSGPQREPAVASITQWKSPTSFLLDTPGRELLQTVPAIGVWPDNAMIPMLEKKHRQVRRPVLP
jgi:hypothetical protein